MLDKYQHNHFKKLSQAGYFIGVMSKKPGLTVSPSNRSQNHYVRFLRI